jgi:predicted amidophosphoribosyltransferase
MGITYNQEEKKFVFDFQHDGKEDIISLTGAGYQVEAFGKCFYYGYEFTEQVESSVRSAFIKYLKFTDSLQEHPDLTNFIKKAVDDLDKQISLYNYDLVVMPESSSKVNQYMLRYIYRFAQPSLHKMEELLADKADEELCASIRKQNVLIIDDVTTSGSTLNEILRTLRILNEDNDITIFSLIGRKDLMAEAF